MKGEKTQDKCAEKRREENRRARLVPIGGNGRGVEKGECVKGERV